MLDRVRERLSAGRRRARRIERRELREFRAWVERTSSVVHLSALAVVPLLLATVTYLSNTVSQLSYLLFPALASGSYTLFTDPEGKYADPWQFVGGLTVGALCGWLALLVSHRVVGQPIEGGLRVSVFGAGLAVFLAGAVTWFGSIEEPSSYSTALLGLLLPVERQPAFVLSVFLASALVAAVFVVWRDSFYEQRARFLYQSTKGDDRVLVPVRDRGAVPTATLGARLASAHEAGKVVLLDVVGDEAAAEAERERLRAHRADDGGDAPATSTESGEGGPAVADAVRTLEDQAARIRRQVGVPCEVLVAVEGDSLASTVLGAADETDCDLIAVPYETEDGRLRSHIRTLFRSEVDVLVHRSTGDRERWRRVMVPVRRTSDVAHSMLDFACRLAGSVGSISVCTCIGADGDRRRAEAMLADLVGPFEGPIETRVSRRDVEPFLETNAEHYDLVFVGASRDRSVASRLLAPPTFERVDDLDTDVAIVDRKH